MGLVRTSVRTVLARIGSLGGILALMAFGGSAFGATYYVDGACANNGNGLLLSCASSSGGSGAFKTVQAGVDALSAPGDILYVRGVHGTFDGRYGQNRVVVDGKHGSTASPIIIQPYGFPSAPETVYIEASLPATWTQCTSTTCAGAPAISQTWFTTKTNDSSNRAYWAQKPDGSITPRKLSLSDLTQQYDGYSCEACDTLYVRWGTTVPPKAFINYSSSGQGFFLQDVSNLVIRGFTLRASIRAGIQVEPPNSNVVISDNRFFYINDSQNGSARPLTAQSSTNISILRNEFAYSSSEALHLTAQTTGSFSGLVAENHVHDVGDPNVLGPGTGGTPNCATITSDAPQPGSTLGDFSGLIVERNIFERCYDKSAILFESHCDGITVRDNVIRQLPLAFKFAANSGGASGHVSNHKIYNNLVYGLVPGSHNGDGNCFLFNGTGAIQNNIAWNNTCAGVLNYGVESQAGAGISGNKFYNNIFVKSGSGSLVNSVQAMTFQNNLLWSGSSTGSFGTIGGASVSCGTNGNRCANPLFVNAASNNYHIGSGSPAIDGATTTGIPAGRGADICNTRALSILGMSYQDCQAAVGTWDIGMDEYSTVSTGGASASLSTSDPSPTAAGNIVVNLTANQNLVQLPGPMTFTDSVGGTRTFSFTGSLPGISFTGVFAVDASIADGTGSFALPSGSLVTSTGATGNAITSVDGVPGASILINKSPPSTPTNLRFGN